MHVASRKLCQELYELSGWEDCQNVYSYAGEAVDGGGAIEYLGAREIAGPAYDLGFLMRKLPRFLPSYRYRGKPCWLDIGVRDEDGPWFGWYAALSEVDVVSDYGVSADTPEDAAAKLCIELFKSGVLSKEPKS